MINSGYHYKECGLPDVWLLNGFIVHDEDNGVSIKDLDGLHATIGLKLVNLPRPLLGVEIRFLRHELDLSQAMLANLLGVDTQTVARWEKAQNEIPGPADRLLRAFYLQSINPSSKVHDLLKELSILDTAMDQHDMCLEWSDAEWQDAA